ncbi:MAG: glutamyl-tRNA amidotransferase [Candidatus Marinimicrobia bacterium]|nr:glutamyl-tRNA amidotransferase [Candidatus Neomarinimicrobiota bacterium]|tara:strand:- start:10716 stop:11156 length:441 start_codon:yes stop_codon:yes gene_type:complete
MLSNLMADMKVAMKKKEKERLQVIRNMISLIKAKQIDLGKTLSDEEAVKLIQSMAKKIKDSIEQYKNGGREDLAKSELNELNIVNSYLPKQLSDDELREIVKETISESKAITMADMNKVMPLLMPKIAGKGDGKIASNIVKEILQR